MSIKLTPNAHVSTREVTINQVLKTYSGRPGCACGCNGKYAYRPETKEIGAKERGYEVDADDIKPKSVAHTIKMVNSAIKGEMEVDCLVFDREFISVEKGNKVWTVYFIR
jgi:hypothetical protein